MMDKLQEWSQENELIKNRHKTKVMKFRKGGTLNSTDIWGTSTGNNKKLQIPRNCAPGDTTHIEARSITTLKAAIEIKNYSSEIVHLKGCAHCHIWHTTHMEPPLVL
jgi:hypothetical protein